MAGADERPCCCSCNCGCKCDATVFDKNYVSVRILGRVNLAPNLYVHTPSKTKWQFVEDMEKEVKDERTRAN